MQIKRNAKRMVGVTGLAVVTVVLAGCWFLPITLNETADGTVQSIEIGDTLIIELAGNASTGFQWVRIEPASFGDGPLEVVSEGDYAPDDPALCGGPGVFSYTYEAVASGTLTLSYVYKQPWEDEVVDEYSVMIWVR